MVLLKKLLSVQRILFPGPFLSHHSTRSSVTRITREERERNRTAGEGEVNRTEPSEERRSLTTDEPRERREKEMQRVNMIASPLPFRYHRFALFTPL